MPKSRHREEAKVILVAVLTVIIPMKYRRVRSAACALLLPIISVSLVGCRKGQLDFGSSDTKALSSAVVLHRTSAKDVVVTDGDEFGIVPGNVQRISMTGPAPNSVVVEFIPFDAKSDPPVPG